MAERALTAFIVEGKAREPQIIDNISNVFFSHRNFKIITLPAGENIYMLWKQLKSDDFDTDIIEVLRERNNDIKNQLEGLSRNDFSEVYLFFDYDMQQTNLGKEENADGVAQMLESFNNETENGRLYISYPMVEALRDYLPGVCGNRMTCFVAASAMKYYKNTSAEQAVYPQFRTYDFEIWKDIIDVFAMRLSCLFESSEILQYAYYSEMISPYEIYACKKKKTKETGVFVLSAFPEFLIDYFGLKLWRTCVKHRKNQRDSCELLTAEILCAE